MPRTCITCGKPFDTLGAHCPECAAKIAADRQAKQAAADKRAALHVWKYEQERRQRKGDKRQEWKEIC